MHLALLYLLASLFVALLAGPRRLGFWGGFFGSILLTPAIGLILVMVSEKASDARRDKPAR